MKPSDFYKLSKPEQRIRIAKDVILQVRKGWIEPTAGYYCQFDTGPEQAKTQELLNKVDKCEACAVGAIFAVAVKNYNKFDGNGSPLPETQFVHLRKYFSYDHLKKIEAFFELWDSSNYVAKNKKKIVEYINERISSLTDSDSGLFPIASKVLMLAIMNNIIKNRGTFVPTMDWAKKIKYGQIK